MVLKSSEILQCNTTVIIFLYMLDNNKKIEIHISYFVLKIYCIFIYYYKISKYSLKKITKSKIKISFLKGVFSKPFGNLILPRFFVFGVRDFKFWLLVCFLISFNCAKFQKYWTTLILDIL